MYRRKTPILIIWISYCNHKSRLPFSLYDIPKSQFCKPFMQCFKHSCMAVPFFLLSFCKILCNCLLHRINRLNRRCKMHFSMLFKIVILQIVQPGCIYSIQSTVLSAVSLPITMLLGKLNLIIVPRISKSGVCNKETKIIVAATTFIINIAFS